MPTSCAERRSVDKLQVHGDGGGSRTGGISRRGFRLLLHGRGSLLRQGCGDRGIGRGCRFGRLLPRSFGGNGKRRGLHFDKRAILATEQAAGELFYQVVLVGRDDDRGARLADFAEQAEELDGSFRVDVPGRLVGKDEGRGVQEGTGEDNALLLAAGKLVGHFILFVCHADLVEDAEDALVDFLFVFPAGGTEDELQVLVDIAVDQELEVLERHPAFAAQKGDLGFADALQLEAGNLCLAEGQGQLGIEGAQEGAFAAADFAGEVNELALEDFKVDILQDGVLLLADDAARHFDYGCWHGVCLWLQVFQTPDGFLRARGFEYKTARHEGIRPCSKEPAAGIEIDPAVDFYARRTAAPGEEGAQLADFLQGMRNERLPAEAGIDAHEQDDVEVLEDVLQGVDGRMGIEGNACLHACRLDLLDGAVQMGGRLSVDGKDVGTRAGECLNVAFGLDNHQMDVQGFAGCLFYVLHNRQAVGDVGDENAVHDVEVEPIGIAAVDHFDVSAQMEEVGREQGR